MTNREIYAGGIAIAGTALLTIAVVVGVGWVIWHQPWDAALLALSFN